MHAPMFDMGMCALPGVPLDLVRHCAICVCLDPGMSAGKTTQSIVSNETHTLAESPALADLHGKSSGPDLGMKLRT